MGDDSLAGMQEVLYDSGKITGKNPHVDREKVKLC